MPEFITLGRGETQGNLWETNGGRVLAVVAGGEDRISAVDSAYAELAKISFRVLSSARTLVACILRAKWVL